MLFLILIAGFVVALVVWLGLRQQAAQSRDAGFQTAAGFAVALSVLFLVLAFAQAVTVVPAGHVGVVDFFGRVSDRTLKPGVNLVNPLARVFKFSVKTQELKEEMDVPSKEGLTVTLEVSCLFHLDPEKAALIYKSVGPNYVEVILQPQFRSVARGVTAAFEAKALYTSEREALAHLFQRDLERLVGPRGIAIEATPLRQVSLPQGLRGAIEQKLQAEQESQRMEFVLTKERQEADRKRIEAQGISDFQNIVAKGISPELLRWKGIEATEKLASSPNAKIVVIGGGDDGLPLILNTPQ